MAKGFNPAGAWQPRGRGFSMGVVQHRACAVHFTDQVAWDERENLIGKDDVRLQTRQWFRSIKTVLYQRSLIMTHLMGRNGLLGRRGVKRDALRIGQAPPGVPLGTQEAISAHRRPRSFARSPCCGPLVVDWHHGQRESTGRA